jgi:hypothetical protein
MPLKPKVRDIEDTPEVQELLRSSPFGDAESAASAKVVAIESADAKRPRTQPAKATKKVKLQAWMSPKTVRLFKRRYAEFYDPEDRQTESAFIETILTSVLHDDAALVALFGPPPE